MLCDFFFLLNTVSPRKNGSPDIEQFLWFPIMLLLNAVLEGFYTNNFLTYCMSTSCSNFISSFLFRVSTPLEKPKMKKKLTASGSAVSEQWYFVGFLKELLLCHKISAINQGNVLWKLKRQINILKQAIIVLIFLNNTVG